MTTYLVLSAFSSTKISLQATTTTVFFFTVYTLTDVILTSAWNQIWMQKAILLYANILLLYSTVQYSAVQYIATVQYSTVQYIQQKVRLLHTQHDSYEVWRLW
jgi:hypothetical protein